MRARWPQCGIAAAVLLAASACSAPLPPAPVPAAPSPPWPAQAPVELDLVAPQDAGRWTLRSTQGQVVCELPCTAPVWPQSRLWLRREVAAGEDEERVRIPDFFAYPPASRLRAEVVPGRSGTWGALLLVPGLLAVQVGWPAALSRCASPNHKHFDEDTCDTALALLAAGGWTAVAGGALWWLYDREASFEVAPAGLAGGRSGRAEPWPRREKPQLELEVHGGVAVPTCSPFGCGSVGAGPAAGGLVLVRPHRYWAFGAIGEYAYYPWDVSSGGLDGAQVESGMLGVAGRLYLVPGAAVEPYLQMAAGGYLYDSTYDSLTAASALAGELAAGIGVPVLRWLRLSASAALVLAVPEETRDQPAVVPGPGPWPIDGAPWVLPEFLFRLGVTTELSGK